MKIARWYVPLSTSKAAVFILSIVAGLIAAWSSHEYLEGKVRQIEREHQLPQVERVVAAYDLAVGDTLQTELLAVRHFPADVVPSGSLAPQQVSELIGKVLSTNLHAGDMVLRSQAHVAGSQPFSQQLLRGRRALTMPVDAINSASGLLSPGDLIDLYVSFDHQQKRITAPLLQGVRVLATGTATGADPDDAQFHGISAENTGYATITLDTSPEDAVKLVAARQSGTITAMLRSPFDHGASQKAARGDLASLLGLSESSTHDRADKRAVVIYGNTSAREAPALRAQPTPVAPAQGVFDLPSSASLAGISHNSPGTESNTFHNRRHQSNYTESADE